ncbi:MAG: tricarballylate utilization 4Fe-4S protein TcuB [Burkholderiales bacterium]
MSSATESNLALTPLAALVKEGERMLTICNACRYCEGYCAVFPAMERRLSFAQGDMSYLANLCHNCGECYYACQFSPPHEFNLNLPQSLAKIRVETYREYAWPQPLAKAFNRNGTGTAMLLVACLVIAMFLGSFLLGAERLFQVAGDGNFYKVIPHQVMVNVFGGVSLFVLLAMLIGIGRAWRDYGEPAGSATNLAGWREALHDAFSLKYLHRDGAGCSVSDTKRSNARRMAHHFTFYGFLLCLAATSLGTVYHYAFGWTAPYGYFSLPVILGTSGGIGLLIGPPTLYMLKKKADPATADIESAGVGNALIWLLFWTSLTGLLLLAFRTTAAMGTLLIVHLAIVMTLFLTLPYGKFIHGFYRLAALLKYAVERKRPYVQVGGDA